MTPRRSARAAARRLYEEMVEEGASTPQSGTPTPTPSPQGGGETRGPQAGGEQAVRGANASAPANAAPPTPDSSPPLAVLAGRGEKTAQARGEQAVLGEGEMTAQAGGEHAVLGDGAPVSSSAAQPDLMAQVRALYEDSAAPVREIARRAGICERTLYKYARKGNWTPRYAWTPDGARPPGRPRRRRAPAQQERAQRFAPTKGSGGRFIRREDAGQAVARGIKALDPAGRAASALACAAAAQRAERARLEAAFDRALARNGEAMRGVRLVADGTGVLAPAHRPPSPRMPAGTIGAQADALCARAQTLSVTIALVRLEASIGALDAAGRALERFTAQNRGRPVTSACAPAS